MVIACPSCSRKLKVSDDASGKRIRCPQCGGMVLASAPQRESQSAQASKRSTFAVLPDPDVTTARDGLVPLLDDGSVPVPELPAKSARRRRAAPDPDDMGEEEETPSPGRAVYGLAIASVLVGIAALGFAWIPSLKPMSLPLGGLGLVLGLVGTVLCLTRHSGAIGFSLAGSAVSFLAVVLGGLSLMGGMHATPVVPEAPRQEAAVVKPAAPPVNDTAGLPAAPPDPDAQWLDVTKGPALRGDLSIQVGVVRQGSVKVNDITNFEGQQSQQVLLVPLILRNLSTTRKIDYRGWAQLLGVKGRLTDNFGNVYKPVTSTLITQIEGQILSATSIYPGKQLEDLLAFEVPVNDVQYLRLELPASAFGGTGTIRLHIPTATRGTRVPANAVGRPAARAN